MELAGHKGALTRRFVSMHSPALAAAPPASLAPPAGVPGASVPLPPTPLGCCPLRPLPLAIGAPPAPALHPGTPSRPV